MDADKPAEFVKPLPEEITETAIEKVPRKRGRPRKYDKSGFSTQAPKITNDIVELEPWEETLAKWLAEQTTRVSWEDECAAIRLLLGHDLTRTAVRRTKRKLGFIRTYQRARAQVMETRMTLAKHRYQQLLPEAALTHRKAVKALGRELDKAAVTPEPGQPGVDVLPILRAAPALLNPFIDRAVPRKTEQQQTQTIITVNLSADQAARLDGPVMVVEAEEVQKQLPETT